jgi:ABC-type nitrate/sulfonate/bicarbonate transport system substrate-binding protein
MNSSAPDAAGSPGRQARGTRPVKGSVMTWMAAALGPLVALVFGGQALAADSVSLRLKWIPQFQFAGYYVALERGYYADAGLDVTIHPGGPDVSAVSMVASGSDDFGIASPDQMYLAAEKGAELKSLMAVFQHSPGGYIVKADSGIEGPKDFEGKTVGLVFGDILEVEYRAMLRAAGADDGRIREVKKTFSLAPFFQDRIPIWTGYITNEPFKAEAEGVAVEVIQPKDYGVDFYGDALFTRAETIAAHPDRVRRFVQASQKGWRYAQANREATITLLQRYNESKSRDHLAFEAEQTLPLLTSEGTETHGFGWQDPARFAYTADKLREAGLLEARIPASDVMTNRFLTHDTGE